MPNITGKYYKTIIKGLIQNTQYAYYVKTQNIQKDHNIDVMNEIQGQSNIMYFKTIANVPTFPIVETTHKTHDSITLNWSPFSSSRDQIGYYRVHLFTQPDEQDFLDDRDYCLAPRISTHQHSTANYEVRPNAAQSTQSCSAEYREWISRHGDSVESELEWRIYRQTLCRQQQSSQQSRPAENHKYYCKEDDRECLSDYVIDDTVQFSRYLHELVTRYNDDDDDTGSGETNEQIEMAALQANFIQEYFFDSTQYSATINELLPFTLYVFQFRSCNDRGCSSYHLHYERTDSSLYADDIDDFNASVDSYESNMIHLDFSQPILPNGLTVGYEIEQLAVQDNKLVVKCITRKSHFANGQR